MIVFLKGNGRHKEDGGNENENNWLLAK